MCHVGQTTLNFKTQPSAQWPLEPPTYLRETTQALGAGRIRIIDRRYIGYVNTLFVGCIVMRRKTDHGQQACRSDPQTADECGYDATRYKDIPKMHESITASDAKSFPTHKLSVH